ncbi:MAG: hypothetical protein GVY36_03495 [Verrucomicrobia bacterium]|nr:hypothetical protein [Verrucomicrobiota bacterium]
MAAIHPSTTPGSSPHFLDGPGRRILRPGQVIGTKRTGMTDSQWSPPSSLRNNCSSWTAPTGPTGRTIHPRVANAPGDKLPVDHLLPGGGNVVGTITAAGS